MVRYFLTMSYIGTRYRGMQKHGIGENVNQVDFIQGAIEAALSRLVPASINPPFLTVSSRTDAGVHALHSSAHVELQNKYDVMYDSSSLIRWANRYFTRCGHDIRITSCVPVTHEFHARHCAKSRTYIYRFLVDKLPGSNSFPISELDRSFHIGSDFDVEKLQKALDVFKGRKDFQTFTPNKKSRKPIRYVRTLNYFKLEKSAPLILDGPFVDNFHYYHLKVNGKSFLYNQVRRMVGALFAVARGRITEKDLRTMVQVPNYKNWNPRATAVPACGLYLADVEYDPEELKRCTIVPENCAVVDLDNEIE
ncbi:uncharacterized protein LOC107269194 isoform X2 [Cephus cinctus]|uniref:tRNA pseudouridine synthase n=1 Tax=Cephus cinctus TaxID=211228 RepID=A0AAJ7BZG7_CEPCN|nr:uncharacterized protein LOC107269194 isoform X2 [Cephus cinctus]